MFSYAKRALHTAVWLAVASGLMFPAAASAQDWPAVFDPLTIRTLNLTIDPADWDTIRFDLTNEIEVPAQFWADGETPILVSVRRKSSRALPSESNPIKIGLKIDINELVSSQQWRGASQVESRECRRHLGAV